MIGLEYALQIAGVSQTDIANQLGIKKQNISIWLSGRQAVSKKHIPQLSEILGVRGDLLQKQIDEEDKLKIQNEYLQNKAPEQVEDLFFKNCISGDIGIETLTFPDGDGEPPIGISVKDFDTDPRFYEIFRNSIMIEFISTWKSIKENYELLCETDIPATEPLNKLLQTYVSIFTEAHNITMSVLQEETVNTSVFVEKANNFAQQYLNVKSSQK